MTHYQPINDSCANCGRPPAEHKQYRDAKPPRCPTREDMLGRIEADRDAREGKPRNDPAAAFSAALHSQRLSEDSDDEAKLARVHHDAECYQAGWAAAVARVSEFPPGSRWQHREDSAVVVAIEKVDGASVYWIGALFGIRNSLSFGEFAERFEPVPAAPLKCECKGTGTTVGPSGFRLCAACYPQGSPAEENRALAARLGATMTAGVVVHGIDPLPTPHPIPDVGIVAEPAPQVVPLHCHGCTDDMCPGCCDCTA